MTPVRIGQRNGFHGLQFRINPLAARKVLGVPAAALAGAVADLNDLVMVQHERLAELDWPQRSRFWKTDLSGLHPVITPTSTRTPNWRRHGR